MFGFPIKARPADRPKAGGAAIKVSEDFLTQVSAEEHQLARDLEEVMSHPPLRRAMPEERRPSPAAEDTFGYEPNDPFRPAGGGFSWNSEAVAEPASEDAEPAVAANETESEDAEVLDLDRQPAPINAAAWLSRARRERTWEKIRIASAYVITALVGGLIVAATAYILTGRHLDVDGLLRF